MVLLEAVPHGEAPSLPHTLREEPVITKFDETSRRVEVVVTKTHEKYTGWTVNGEIPASTEDGLKIVVVELAEDDGQPVKIRGFSKCRFHDKSRPSHPGSY